MWEENENLLFLHLKTAGQIVYFHIYLSFVKKTEDLQIFQIWIFFSWNVSLFKIVINYNYSLKLSKRNELAFDLL